MTSELCTLATVISTAGNGQRRGRRCRNLGRSQAFSRARSHDSQRSGVARDFCAVTGLGPAAREMHRRGLGHRQLRLIESVLVRSRRERHRACVASDNRTLARVI